MPDARIKSRVVSTPFNNNFWEGISMTYKAIFRGSTAAVLVAASTLFAVNPAFAQDLPANGAGAPAGGTVQPAAEESSEPNLGDVITVTARRREENMMTVPIAVAVMGSAAIEASGAKNLNDVAQFTPGLFIKPQGAGTQVDRSQARLVFRGLSTSEGPIFIDGAPFSGNGSPDVTDVERIEVLNGPQSVYFGRSTFSGAVNYVTKTPGNDFKGRVSAEATTYDGFDGRLMFEGPIVRDLLTFRVSGRRYSYGGQYKNGIDGIRLGSESTTGLSAALAFTPSSNVKVGGYYSYRLDDDGPAPSAALRAVGGAPNLTCALGGTGGPYWCGELPSLSGLNPITFGGNATMDPLSRSELVDNVRGAPTPYDPRWHDRYGMKRLVHHAHLRVDISTDSGWEFSVLGAYSRTKYSRILSQNSLDTTNLTNPFYPVTPALLAAACAAVQPGPAFTNACFAPARPQLNTHQMSISVDKSIEGRISTPQDKRIRATIGASYYNVATPVSTNIGIQNSGRLINGGNGGLTSGVSTPAVFGGIYFDVTDDLTVTAEARYQWDGIEAQQLFPAVGPALSDTFKSFSPRVIVNYDISPDSMAYATFSRGYRPGGFNPNLTTLTPTQLAQIQDAGSGISFLQEQLDNYEVGHKGTWFDNRLRTTLALYYMKWRNGQIRNTQFFTNTNGSTGSIAITTNAGSVDLKGVEFEANFAATRELTLSGTMSYSTNKLINFVYSPNGLSIQGSNDVSGRHLEQTPKFQASFSPSYKREIMGDWELNARADFLYRSKYFIDYTNVAWIGARGIVNASLGFSHDNFKLDFFVRNLLNNDTIAGAARTSDSVYGVNTTCTLAVPTCYNPALPSVISPGVGALNLIAIGLPEQRTFGVRASMQF
jgi:iron complex outermembrane recepter protein